MLQSGIVFSGASVNNILIIKYKQVLNTNVKDGIEGELKSKPPRLASIIDRLEGFGERWS